jgi:predicted SPOUT superfamily RNA methylase MTH1
MFELTIKGKIYQFRFGIGFVREIDKTKKEKTESGAEVNVGLQYAVAALIDEDPVALVDILFIANKTEDKKARVTKEQIEDYIDYEVEDLEGLFKEVLDFFEKSNATKKKTAAILKLVEEENAKAAAVNQTE